MIIIGTQNEIDRLGFEPLALASLVLVLHADYGVIIKDRFSLITQRKIDFPELGEVFEQHLSEIQIEDSIDNEVLPNSNL